MTKKALLLALGVSVLGAGCVTDPRVKEPWETKVNRQVYMESLYFKRGATDLSPQERRKINQLVSKTKPKLLLYAVVTLNTTDAKAHKNPHAARLKILKKYLADLGIERHRIRVATLEPAAALRQGSINQNMITLTLEQYEIVMPECKGWPVMGTVERPNGEQEFGCVNEYNFANMVAEPKDLYDSLPLAQRDGPTNATYLKKFREGKQKELRVEKVETEK